MTDKDRLIELISHKQCYGSPVENGVKSVSNETLADYLIANGVIVPPCKVGDTVYRITKLYGGEKIIVEGEAFEFAITHEHSNKYEHRFYFCAKGEEFIHRHYSLWCDFTDFGKTVFLTPEEAEKALLFLTAQEKPKGKRE